jgi:methionyl-tRNA synthetase
MKDGLQREIRKQRALERLNSDNPRCIYCGEADWRCLESHHIAGRAYDEERAVVCRNCHRKLSDMQRDHPVALESEEPPYLEKIGHFLLGLADLLEMLIEKLREYGMVLIEAAANCPRPYGIQESAG